MLYPSSKKNLWPSRLVFINKPGEGAQYQQVLESAPENLNLSLEFLPFVYEVALGFESSLKTAHAEGEVLFFVKKDEAYNHTDLFAKVLRAAAYKVMQTISRYCQDEVSVESIKKNPLLKPLIHNSLEFLIDAARKTHAERLKVTELLAQNNQKDQDYIQLLNEAGYDSKMPGFINCGVLAGEKILDKRLEELMDKFPVALCFADIDHFGAINIMGDHIGDACLTHAGKLIQQSSWPDRQDCIWARLGGEELGVYLGGTDLRQMVVVAERIRKTFEENPAFILEEYVQEKGEHPKLITRLISPEYYNQIINDPSKAVEQQQDYDHGRKKIVICDRNNPALRSNLYNVPMTLSIGVAEYTVSDTTYSDAVKKEANTNMNLAKSKKTNEGRNRIAAEGKVITPEMIDRYREEAKNASQSSRTLLAANLENLKEIN